MKYIKKVVPSAKDKLATGAKEQISEDRPKGDRPGCVPVSGD